MPRPWRGLEGGGSGYHGVLGKTVARRILLGNAELREREHERLTTFKHLRCAWAVDAESFRGASAKTRSRLIKYIYIINVRQYFPTYIALFSTAYIKTALERGYVVGQ